MMTEHDLGMNGNDGSNEIWMLGDEFRLVEEMDFRGVVVYIRLLGK